MILLPKRYQPHYKIRKEFQTQKVGWRGFYEVVLASFKPKKDLRTTRNSEIDIGVAFEEET